MQYKLLTNLLVATTHTKVAVCAVDVCVCVCPGIEPSHTEGRIEWWHALAASCHDLIHSERQEDRETEWEMCVCITP